MVAPGPEVTPVVCSTPLLVFAEVPDGNAPGTWDVVLATGSRVFPK